MIRQMQAKTEIDAVFAYYFQSLMARQFRELSLAWMIDALVKWTLVAIWMVAYGFRRVWIKENEEEWDWRWYFDRGSWQL